MQCIVVFERRFFPVRRIELLETNDIRRFFFQKVKNLFTGFVIMEPVVKVEKSYIK
jgi:hypothetical protein